VSGGSQRNCASRAATHWKESGSCLRTYQRFASRLLLKKAWSRQRFQVRAVPTEEKGEILKAYVDRFRPTVQRYFPVPAGSEPQVFLAVADRYPVFELRPFSDASDGTGVPSNAQR
jgi:hypothetical protein